MSLLYVISVLPLVIRFNLVAANEMESFISCQPPLNTWVMLSSAIVDALVTSVGFWRKIHLLFQFCSVAHSVTEQN